MPVLVSSFVSEEKGFFEGWSGKEQGDEPLCCLCVDIRKLGTCPCNNHICPGLPDLRVLLIYETRTGKVLNKRESKGRQLDQKTKY